MLKFSACKHMIVCVMSKHLTNTSDFQNWVVFPPINELWDGANKELLFRKNFSDLR